MKTLKSNLKQLHFRFVDNGIKRSKIEGSGDAYEVFKQVFNPDTVEVFETMWAIFLNRANYTIGYQKISDGGVSGTVCDPKLIYSAALEVGASGLILAHNHPSGNLKASSQDLALTKKIKEAGSVLEIQLLDHLIITANTYTSFSDEAML
jgi:DNA repair protein RadC